MTMFGITTKCVTYIQEQLYKKYGKNHLEFLKIDCRFGVGVV